ncbi:MAG: Glycosyl transferase group 1 [Candidatus Adlerbacteria bacterium GW2011_GWC1_50_9]|uniref:Glycosyl transferase group 1 n=1 Tax=Candidatus Adlerbacteria bacterium GW2011_GWC1_50_9 TaxID=1618608 RepID=A0A0G1ZKI0_9BACT|nr:MAG: Glycosyl transferase group 1 [Candidatus Adlerbacteria bacterium GW2011_GWC1_50_9]
MKRGKILYLITKATFGGAQKYVYDLATSLPKERFEPIVAYGTHGKLAENLYYSGIMIHHLPSLGRDIAIISDIKSFLEIYRYIKETRPDVVHLNSSKAAALGALAARLAGVRSIIFTVHGWPFKEDRRLPLRLGLYLVSWLTALLSHTVIVVSISDDTKGKRMWFVRKKINYIHLALKALETYTRAQAEVLLFEHAGLFLNSIRLVTIAELTPNKGLRYGIEMMKELEEHAPQKYTYSIIGNGEERSSLPNYAEELGVSQSVSFESLTPNKPPENLSTEAFRYLPAFDIFILPSIKEGMPYVLLEAAAAGLSIVATDVVKSEASNIPNIQIVPSKSGRALANAVEKISRDTLAQVPYGTHLFKHMLDSTIELYA